MAIIDSVKLPDNSTYDVADNYSGYQKATLTTPITIDGTSETTVEGALGALNIAKQGTTLTTPLTIDGTEKTTVETALGGLNDYGDALKGKISHENLLINPFFTINQRGQASYTSDTSVKHTVDAWSTTAATGNTVTVTSNGVTVSNSAAARRGFQQLNIKSDIVGKTVTLSIKIYNGPIYKGTGVAPTVGNQINFDFGTNSTLRLENTANGFVFALVIGSNESFDFRAAKLELGSVSTLANDVEPNDAEELLKCQRSFIRFGARSSSSFLAVLTATSSTTALGVLPLPADMSGTMHLTYAGTFTLVDSGTDISVTGIAIRNACTNLQGLQVTVSGGLTAGHAVLMYADSGSYIDITT